MFVGHYGAALALKSAERRVSLGLLFLGVQFVDLLFFPLVAVGVERMSIVPNATASTHFTLNYMPYTHSLVASVAWSALVFVVAYVILGCGRPGRISISFVLAASVMSHWIFDLIVHTPDLPPDRITCRVHVHRHAHPALAELLDETVVQELYPGLDHSNILRRVRGSLSALSPKTPVRRIPNGVMFAQALTVTVESGCRR